ncbi:MAG: sporulation protein YqfD [Firmicutes bacterium]|nr:sporulation protein YqfD [Bacillota bacterium]
MKGQYGEWNFYRYRVKVRIEGFKVERLLTEASSAGILMKNIRRISDAETEGWIAERDYKRLKKIGGSLYRITVVNRQGPEYSIRMAWSKPATCCGAALAAVIVTIQSLFIASVKIDGYKAIPEDSLRICLKQSGIYEGAYRPEIDWEKARENIRETFPQITWIQLVYDGRTAILNVAETDGKILSSEAGEGSDSFVPLVREETVYCDIIADYSGYIESINTLWGRAMVEAGDFVKKGDVLISGSIPIEPTTFEENPPSEYYVKSRGEIKALIPYRLTFNQERYVVQDGNGENLVANLVEKSKKQAEAVAKQQIRLWIKENLPENAEIVNESLNFSYKNNIIEVGVTLEVRRQIGIEKEIVVGQENSDN